MTRLIKSSILFALVLACTATHAESPSENGVAAIPDSWLLASKGPSWWYTSKPSPSPVQLQERTPSAAEQVVIDKARALVATNPAKGFALMDGNTVLYTEFNAPANADSLFMGMSMGKTVTAMGVGKAICAGHLRFDTKAGDAVPELDGTALGKATVRELLRMSSGTATFNADASVWTPEQNDAWNRGTLNILEMLAADRVSKAAKGVFSDYKPGEKMEYKATDPMTLAVVTARSTGTAWSQWLQEQVFNPMGAAKPGLYGQDRSLNGLADSGMRLRMDDWMRFALWVKQSSKEPGCFGDYVRAAMTTQITNGPASTRKSGKLFGGYGYLMWTENDGAPNTVWAVGWGGQRISWSTKNDRMLVLFSSREDFMGKVYALAKEWSAIPAQTAKP